MYQNCVNPLRIHVLYQVYALGMNNQGNADMHIGCKSVSQRSGIQKASMCTTDFEHIGAAGCRAVYGPVVARCLLTFQTNKGSGAEQAPAAVAEEPCFSAEVMLLATP